MKFAEWVKTRTVKKRRKTKVFNPDHIQHPHWKKPVNRAKRKRHKAAVRRMQSLSRRRNR